MLNVSAWQNKSSTDSSDLTTFLPSCLFLYLLYLEDLSWVPAETLAVGPTPEARMGHTATYDPESKRIFVFGGSKHKKWFNDVHILDTQSWHWTMVEVISFFICVF